MGRAGEFDATLWFRLVERDRWLLALLADHRVLTTEQIAAIAFGSVRRAQDRLRILRQMGAVFAFRHSYQGGGTSPNHYLLGYLGARLIAAQREQKPPTAPGHQLYLERLAASPTLGHLLGVNQFFCDLIAHSRTHPRGGTCSGSGARRAGLLRWVPERATVIEVLGETEPRYARVRPDGYGVWAEQGRAVEFFLEHDTGTETITKVVNKLAGYAAYNRASQAVLLFSVHSARRETAVRAALATAYDHAVADARYDDPAQTPLLPLIATAPRDHGHPDGPAGPAWAVWTPPGPPPQHQPPRQRPDPYRHGNRHAGHGYAQGGYAGLPPPAPTLRRYRLAQLTPRGA